MSRPTVDVVVPFAGEPAGLARTADRLAQLRLGPNDTLSIVDNRPDARAREAPGGVRIVPAPDLRTPAHARNRGAAAGSAEWLVFVDSDTVPAADLLDLYLAEEPLARTGLLAGGILDSAPEGGNPDSPAARWAVITRSMSQDTTLGLGPWAFAQTANCAVRREAFTAVGGFRDELRACEDADLCYRLREAGWGIERRERARVLHESRPTVRGLLSQQLVHGAGIGWLEREYPGAAPAHRWPGFLLWGIRHASAGLVRALRARDRSAAVVALIDPLVAWTRELGRGRPNIRAAAR